ncbi:hypothetical protein K504DRAFT_459259 [Pleomassaria siparia CBS 279.74]|uniref:Uncharacterized protein n=1 Tax=Pleomassaria siparia CBS 279.74 TaxID=1314801 RepID=A0A6G1K209_9PLEO|nr:hypothetical protein K504DRAFT_459259 [Pleomassaria siparia CBS 279.74]
MRLLISLVALLPLATASSIVSHQLQEDRTQVNVDTGPHESCHQRLGRSCQRFSNPDPNTLARLPDSSSPRNGHGRSETLDYITTWTGYPRRCLNGYKYPLGSRCRRTSNSKLNPRAKSTPLPRPNITPPEPGEPAALAGPQLADSTTVEDEGNEGCKLAK